MRTKQLLSVAVLGGALVMSAASANGAALLDDQFDDGALGTNTTGVGTGFTLFQGFGSGGTAVESGGTVNLLGNGTNVVTHIQSNDTFDPTDLTLTWVITSATNSGFNGAGVGWVNPGDTPGGGVPAVELELRADRLTFDLLDGAGNFTRQVGVADGSVAANAAYDWDFSSPVVAEITLGATGWSLSVTGTGVSVIQSGLYTGFGTGGFQVAGSTVTLGSILAASDSGELATYATAIREPGNTVVESVTLVPEPGSLALLGLGGMMALRRRR